MGLLWKRHGGGIFYLPGFGGGWRVYVEDAAKIGMDEWARWVGYSVCGCERRE